MIKTRRQASAGEHQRVVVISHVPGKRGPVRASEYYPPFSVVVTQGEITVAGARMSYQQARELWNVLSMALLTVKQTGAD